MPDVVKADDVPGEVVSLASSVDSLASHAKIANELHEDALACAGSAVQYAIRCGEELEAAKALVPRGEWVKWIQQNFRAGVRTAQRYQQVAANQKVIAKHTTDVTRLSLREALRISSKKPPKSGQKPSYENRNDDQWTTPPEVVESARSVMGGIDLDPASDEVSQQIVNAESFYTASDNGLDKEWFGRVWLNPPYSRPLCGQFVDKLIDSFGNGAVAEACVLLPARTDNAQFHSLCELGGPVCFTRGRFSFGRVDEDSGKGMLGSVIFFLSEDPKQVTKFVTEFTKYGLILGLYG